MAGREPPYDPYIPSGSGGAGEHSGQNGENPRTAALQAVSTVSFDNDSQVHWNSGWDLYPLCGLSQSLSARRLPIQRDHLHFARKSRDNPFSHHSRATCLRVVEQD